VALSHPPILLVVEDDESSRAMYSEYLQSAGYWVLDAADGARALQLAREYRPNLVVTDLTMPGIDGWQLARALKATAGTPPVIAVSGVTADDHTTAHAHDVGIDLLLVKPCLPDRLLAEVKRLLEKSREIRTRSNKRIAKVRDLRERSDRLLARSRDIQSRRRRG
jgi:DNA-binding response OmpR family regulator